MTESTYGPFLRATEEEKEKQRLRARVEYLEKENARLRRVLNDYIDKEYK